MYVYPEPGPGPCLVRKPLSSQPYVVLHHNGPQPMLGDIPANTYPTPFGTQQRPSLHNRKGPFVKGHKEKGDRNPFLTQ